MVIVIHVIHVIFRSSNQADNSGTIEAAEFIGPLSRWAHDSKTAPRFIKYNMLQTMQLQEDLYDMCADCFKHLSLQIDQVACDVKAVRKKGKAPPEAPEDQSPTISRDLMQRLSQRKSHAKTSVVEGKDEGSPGSPSSTSPEPLSPAPESPESPSSPNSPGLEIGPRARSIIELGADPHQGQSSTLTVEPRNSVASVKDPDFHLNMDLNEELEHVMGLRPSQATMLLTEILGSTAK